MREVPLRFQRFNRDHPRIAEAYEKLASECANSGPLNEKERALAKLGIAIGCGMEGAVRSQVRKALDAGLTVAEIRHVFLLALTTIGFPRMMAAMTWVEDMVSDETTGSR